MYIIIKNKSSIHKTSEWNSSWGFSGIAYRFKDQYENKEEADVLQRCLEAWSPGWRVVPV